MPPPLVGAASSSVHSEGAAPASDWGGWEANGWVPSSGDGNGFATTHADDAALLAAHGLGSWRVTLEWARLEPRATGRLDGDEVERYRRVLRSIRDAGLEAWACLAHTTLPGWFSEDERGFLDDKAAKWIWPAHVDRVAEAFGDLVDGWITFHEPVRYALDAWLLGRLPPGRTDGDDAQTGLRNLLAADAHAARLLHVPGGAPVASCHWLPSVTSLDTSPAAKQAAESAVELLWRVWRDHDVHDLLGVSSSFGIAVDGGGTFHPWPTAAGHAPDAVAEALHRVGDERRGRPVVLLTGVWHPDPDERAVVTTDLAAAVDEAVADGVDLRHVHWWSAIDGYEGWAGFDTRSGLFDRDRNPVTVGLVVS